MWAFRWLIDPLIGTSNETNCMNPIGRWLPSIISSYRLAQSFPLAAFEGKKMTYSHLADVLWLGSFKDKLSPVLLPENQDRWIEAENSIPLMTGGRFHVGVVTMCVQQSSTCSIIISLTRQHTYIMYWHSTYACYS